MHGRRFKGGLFLSVSISPYCVEEMVLYDLRFAVDLLGLSFLGGGMVER